MLRPHVDAWNTWYVDCGNSAEGFAALDATITAAARDARRDPGEIARSACVLVVLDRAAGERPITPDAPPLEGTSERLAERLRELADAGANEVILVVSPITERSIRLLGDVRTAVKTAPNVGAPQRSRLRPRDFDPEPNPTTCALRTTSRRPRCPSGSGRPPLC
jgi:hypothetical protein